MELGIEEASKYAMSAVDPDFAKKVKLGDFFVAENNLGSGSSRETAPLSLKYLGIRAVVAKFFARIFYRNAINVGLIAVECQEADEIADADELVIDYEAGIITNKTQKKTHICSKIPSHILELIEAGGMYEYLKQKHKTGFETGR